MAGKSTFVDYDPVTRQRGAKRVGLDDVDMGVAQETSFRRSAEASEGALSSDRWPEKDGGLLEGRSKLVDRPEPWLKRGHTVTYIGLFLFTFLVYFRPYELSPSLSWLANSAFWVALFTVAVFVPTQLGLENRITIRPREVNLVLLLAIAGLLSIAFALDRLKAWYSLLEYLKVVLMFIVTVNVVRTEKRLKGLWFLVLTVTCLLSLSAIIDYSLGRLVLRGVRIKGMIGGLFENPNDLALHLVTMIPIAIALLLSSKGPLKKVFYLGCAIATTAGVVVTFSRGGFLALVFTGGVLLWRLARRSRVLIGSIGAITVVLFIAFAPGGYSGRLSTTRDDSAMARYDDLKRSIFVAAHHPVFGVGMDNYVLYSNSNHATHNAYTQVAAEIGFPAMLLYLIFLITPLKELRRIASETSFKGPAVRFHYQAIGLEASLIGYMVASFFASVAFLWYAYYLIAYAICLSRIYESEQTNTSLQGQ